MSDGLNSDSNWVVICATQRSGSTLLCEDLTNLGIGRPEEWYLPFVGDKQHDVEFVEGQVTARGSNGERAAVKVMANYAAGANSALGGSSAAEPELWTELARFHEGATWLFLRREDPIRQALSRIRSRRTGINHLVADKSGSLVPGRSVEDVETDYDSSLKIDSSRIAAEVLQIAVEEEMWKRFFAAFGIKPIELTYDEVVSGALGSIPDLASEMSDDSYLGQRRLKKLPASSTEERVTQLVRDRPLAGSGSVSWPEATPNIHLSERNVELRSQLDQMRARAKRAAAKVKRLKATEQRLSKRIATLESDLEAIESSRGYRAVRAYWAGVSKARAKLAAHAPGRPQ